MKIAVVLGKGAPFHVSRLEAAGSLAMRRGHAVVGLEVAESQRDYTWSEPSPEPAAFRRRVLIPGREYWSMTEGEIDRAVRGALDAEAPDVVVLVGYAFRESRSGLSWAARKNVPRVLVSESHRLGRRRDAAWRRLGKRAVLASFDAAVVAGAPQKRYLCDLGFDGGRTFPGAAVIDNDRFEYVARRRTAEDDGTRFFSAIRLIPEKNVPFVLETMAGDGMNWRWTIAGDGPLRASIQNEISRLRLGQRVTLLGHVDYSGLPALYRQADVYLQPSISEQWGLAVNEAMASGLPIVVSTRCGCVEDLLEVGSNGFSFDPTEPASLVEAVERIQSCRDRWQEMGEASRARIDRWDLSLFAESFLSAVEMAVKRPRARKMSDWLMAMFA